MSGSEDFAKSIGQDLHAQHALWRYQRIGMVLMVLLILSSVAGVLATGLFSSRREASEGSFKVTYDQVTHYMESHTFEVTLLSSHRLKISQGLLEAIQIEEIVPEPTRMVREGQYLRLEFEAPQPEGELKVTFHYKAIDRGILRGEWLDGNGGAVRMTQVNFP